MTDHIWYARHCFLIPWERFRSGQPLRRLERLDNNNLRINPYHVVRFSISKIFSHKIMESHLAWQNSSQVALYVLSHVFLCPCCIKSRSMLDINKTQLTCSKKIDVDFVLCSKLIISHLGWNIVKLYNRIHSIWLCYGRLYLSVCLIPLINIVLNNQSFSNTISRDVCADLYTSYQAKAFDSSLPISLDIYNNWNSSYRFYQEPRLSKRTIQN